MIIKQKAVRSKIKYDRFGVKVVESEGPMAALPPFGANNQKQIIQNKKKEL